MHRALDGTVLCADEQTLLSLGDVAVWLPLHSGDALQGLLLIGRRPGGDFFTAEDERILATVAHQAGIAGHEAQRLSRELKPDMLLLDLSMPGPLQTARAFSFRDSTPVLKK